MIKLDDVRVTFSARLAFSADSLTLESGSTVALMGPNGSGKTTMIRLVAGLLSPTHGSISTPADLVVSYVAQHQHQHQWMPLTVSEVLIMGRYRHRGLLGRLVDSDRRVVARSAERLEISDLLSRRFSELSGGQRQRVLVAGALTVEASCLLLDEPITGLDLASQQIILDVIDSERAAGRLVVMSTHHIEEARHCDRIILLNTVVVADGSPNVVLTETNLQAAFGPRLLATAGDGIEASRVIVIDEHGHGQHIDSVSDTSLIKRP
ncbi:MAG: metal ABC transporter ATP-binding protein [Acidimicrobiales bacterium]